VATSRRTTAFAGLAFAALVLTGCSAGAPAASAQTTEQACDILKTGVESTTSELQSGLSDLATDPQAAADAVTTLTEAFEKSSADVDNTEVKNLADDATTALTEFDEQIHDYADDPASVDSTAIQASAEKVQTAIAAIGETCP
jgi:hypothetical protein